MHIPKIDNYEASAPTRPADVQTGDHIATGWSSADLVLNVEPTASGAYLTLAPEIGATYRIHRRSPVPVIHN